MTSPFPGFARRNWLEACSLSVSIAAVASITLIASTTRAPEASIMRAAATERVVTESVLPPAALAANEGRNEQVPERTGDEPATELRADESQPPVQDIAGPATMASHDMPSAAPTPDPEMEEVNQYLWGVYQRSTIKRDGGGDFTWKDVAAAARLGITLGDYVIGGMDGDFRELLYRAGLEMDAAGIRWTILSAFRDDYRQGLASGYKARLGDSLHGGSYTTGGYGHGCAVDIADADGKSRILWTWLDSNSARLGLERPLAGLDPPHVQPRGPWHEVASALRQGRLAPATSQGTSQGRPQEGPSEDVATVATPVDLSTVSPSEADMKCIGLHHHPLQANTAAPAEHQGFKLAAGTDGTGKANAGDTLRPGAGSRSAGRSPGESKAAARAGSRLAESKKSSTHAKGAGRSLARHALHVPARDAGAS
jgi:hypothetical protein